MQTHIFRAAERNEIFILPILHDIAVAIRGWQVVHGNWKWLWFFIACVGESVFAQGLYSGDRRSHLAALSVCITFGLKRPKDFGKNINRIAYRVASAAQEKLYFPPSPRTTIHP